MTLAWSKLVESRGRFNDTYSSFFPCVMWHKTFVCVFCGLWHKTFVCACIIRCQNLSKIVEHWRPLTTIVEHCRTLTTIVEYCRRLSKIAPIVEHCRRLRRLSKIAPKKNVVSHGCRTNIYLETWLIILYLRSCMLYIPTATNCRNLAIRLRISPRIVKIRYARQLFFNFSELSEIP